MRNETKHEVCLRREMKRREKVRVPAFIVLSVAGRTLPNDDSNPWMTMERTLSAAVERHSRHLMRLDCHRSLDA